MEGKGLVFFNCSEIAGLGIDTLNEAEARESASWRNLEICLIEPWTEECFGSGDEEFVRGRMPKGYWSHGDTLLWLHASLVQCSF